MRAHQDRIGRLLGDETLARPSLGHPLRLDDLVRGEGRAAEVPDLARPHQIGQRAESLVDVRLGRGAVDLVQVDVVGAEPAQAVVALGDDPAPRVPLGVGVLPHLPVHLGGEHDLVPLGPGQGLAHDLLGLAERVDVGGVDEIDPGVERGMDDPDGFVVIRGAPGPEHHGPQAQGADLYAGPAERAVLHRTESSHGSGGVSLQETGSTPETVAARPRPPSRGTGPRCAHSCATRPRSALSRARRPIPAPRSTSAPAERSTSAETGATRSSSYATCNAATACQT